MRYGIVFLCLIGGCASKPYWTRTHAPMTVNYIEHVEYPCGQKLDGCWTAATRTIELRHGMREWLEQCRIRHEFAHARGWRHPLGMELSEDCGPEEI